LLIKIITVLGLALTLTAYIPLFIFKKKSKRKILKLIIFISQQQENSHILEVGKRQKVTFIK
jgi:hypothetical protein